MNNAEQMLVGRSQRFGMRRGHLNTIFPAICVIIIFFLRLVAIVFIELSPDDGTLYDGHECPMYFGILYMEMITWIFISLFYFHVSRVHNNIRVEGFIELTGKIDKYPFRLLWVSSMFTTSVFFAATVFYQLRKRIGNLCDKNLFGALFVIWLVGVFESIFLLLQTIIYINIVRDFNKGKNYPDVLRDDWMATFIRDSYSNAEIGNGEQSNQCRNLLEKQADILRCLLEQNRLLKDEISLENASESS